jgi:hypothetical protein
MENFGGSKNQRFNINLKRNEKNFVEKNKILAFTYKNKSNKSNVVDITNNNEVGVVIKCLNEVDTRDRPQLKPMIRVQNEKLKSKINKHLIPTHDNSLSSISSESSVVYEVSNSNELENFNQNLLKDHFAQEV